MNACCMHVTELYALTPINSNLYSISMNSYSYSASKYGICKGELQFYKIKHKKLSLISLKLTQKSLWYQKLLQHASHIKIKQMKLINMVSIKRSNHIIH